MSPDVEGNFFGAVAFEEWLRRYGGPGDRCRKALEMLIVGERREAMAASLREKWLAHPSSVVGFFFVLNTEVKEADKWVNSRHFY